MFLKKIKSSSIIELITAMLIFITVFSIALTILPKINNSSTIEKIEAREILNSTLNETKTNKRYVDLSFSKKKFDIDQKIKKISKDLYEVRLEIKVGNKKIDEIYETLEVL